MSVETESAPTQALTRILITADAVGGVWQYTIDLVRGLVQSGVAVMVATMGPRPSEEQAHQMPPGVQLVTSEYALEWNSDPWHEVDEAGHWLLQLRDQFRPELVHLNGYVHASLSWRCPVLVVAHSCVVSWWQAVHGCDPGPEWNEYRHRVRAGLLACDSVAAPSNFMAGEIASHYRIPLAKVRTIWNYSSTVANGTRMKQPFCLAAGRTWDEAKNFGLLPEVARKTPWPVYLAGGDAADSFMPMRVLGRVPYEELLERMRRASIFLHPALYEPFGLAVLEAARAGCCLVLSNTASARELWEGAAIFADPRDASQWIDVLFRLSGDPGECERMGRAAQEHSRRYDEGRFRHSYSELYCDLLRRFGSRTEAAA